MKAIVSAGSGISRGGLPWPGRLMAFPPFLRLCFDLGIAILRRRSCARASSEATSHLRGIWIARRQMRVRLNALFQQPVTRFHHLAELLVRSALIWVRKHRSSAEPGNNVLAGVVDRQS